MGMSESFGQVSEESTYYMVLSKYLHRRTLTFENVMEP